MFHPKHIVAVLIAMCLAVPGTPRRGSNRLAPLKRKRSSPGQQLVGGRSADQRRAHHCPALSCPDARAERRLFARRLEQTLICGA
jgi:hypothetical protein